MEILQTAERLRSLRAATTGRVAIVPTMGALHAGHLSLVKLAQRNADAVVVTIFVNPTQFAPTDDLDRYPRPVDEDLKKLSDAGVTAVFLPTEAMMYPRPGATVCPPPVAEPLEGHHRPGHFRGVCTVVLKLLNLVQPDVAVFGQKDFQQLRVIEDMVADLNVPVTILRGSTARDADGLAMSSRNVYLTADQRSTALAIPAALQSVAAAVTSGQTDVDGLQSKLRERLTPLDRLDYAVVVDARTLLPIDRLKRPAVALVAGHVGGTRLIDNRILDVG